jgi:hypothetical protein
MAQPSPGIPVPTTEDVVNEVLHSFENDAVSYERRAATDRRLYQWSTVIIAVLTAVTPALVAYAAQGQDLLLGLVGAGLARLGGAIATIRAALRWGTSYGRYRLAALELADLQAETLAEKDRIIKIFCLKRWKRVYLSYT